MNKSIDERIEEALASAPTEGPGISELLRGVYKGRLAWLNIVYTLASVAVTGACVLCLVNMLRAGDALSAVKWGVGVLAGMLAVSLMKVWFFISMQSLVVLRAIKRLEARLTQPD